MNKFKDPNTILKYNEGRLEFINFDWRIIYKGVDIINKNSFDEKYNELRARYGEEIPLGKYYGISPPHECDTNSYKRKSTHEVYKGKILFATSEYDQGWNCLDHIFNVKNGMVYEYTNMRGIDMSQIHYFGEPYTGNIRNIWD